MALVLTKLVRSNYDELDNIPVIRQDLTNSFTKQAGTYYIHTGSTTSAYIKGRMYYCDGTNLKKVVVVDELTDTGATSLEVPTTGNALTGASYDSIARKITFTKGTFLINHQSIKSINTNNTAAQIANVSEAIAGSGTINLHKVSKTGNYNDLLNKLTAGSNITINENNVISAKDTTYTFTASNPTLA